MRPMRKSPEPRDPRRKKRRDPVSISIQAHPPFLEKKKANLAPREQDNSEIRGLGDWSAGDWKQNIDYTVPVA